MNKIKCSAYEYKLGKTLSMLAHLEYVYDLLLFKCLYVEHNDWKGSSFAYNLKISVAFV